MSFVRRDSSSCACSLLSLASAFARAALSMNTCEPSRARSETHGSGGSRQDRSEQRRRGGGEGCASSQLEPAGGEGAWRHVPLASATAAAGPSGHAFPGTWPAPRPTPLCGHCREARGLVGRVPDAGGVRSRGRIGAGRSNRAGRAGVRVVEWTIGASAPLCLILLASFALAGRSRSSAPVGDSYMTLAARHNCSSSASRLPPPESRHRSWCSWPQHPPSSSQPVRRIVASGALSLWRTQVARETRRVTPLLAHRRRRSQSKRWSHMQTAKHSTSHQKQRDAVLASARQPSSTPLCS